MGIPSYFAHVVRRYRSIIKDVKKLSHVNNLYLDCNSIIYDAVKRNGLYDKSKNDIYERSLINSVCERIEEYISLFSPSDKVLIAFDGVAPVAKLNQQRDRRYKSWYTTEMQKMIEGKDYVETWSTTAITPGTKFMTTLNIEVCRHFANIPYNESSPNREIIVSSSAEPGEGEHKIFEYIRKNANFHKTSNTLIYGLDADLIMLTLNHLEISNNLFLFRDTPEFIKSIDSTLDANKNYLLDIPELACSIIKYMNNYKNNDNSTKEITDEVNEEKSRESKSSTYIPSSVQSILEYEKNKNRISDYILLCFFLGNDFLPHFPAMNIRTFGIDILLDAYRETVGKKKDTYLTTGTAINWKILHDLISNISKNEETFLREEHKKRDKYRNYVEMNGTKTPSKTFQNGTYHRDPHEPEIKSMDDLLMLPMKERSIEKYINPFKKDWEYRYYKTLFDITIDDERRKEICMNFLEGLEWTFKYYTVGCIDWRWTYNYHYPPLLIDLIKYIPYFDTTFLKDKGKNPIQDIVQLCYVLPLASHNLLPDEIAKYLKHKCGHLYGLDYEFKWSYCKFFWEGHADLPHINLELLENNIRRINENTKIHKDISKDNRYKVTSLFQSQTKSKL
jgi:5'-3' exonuclease